MFSPVSIEELASFVAESKVVITPVGGRTKFPENSRNTPNLSTAALTGILEYEPSEYIITALAGTPISKINQALSDHNQYLPFDPPLVKAGATLGGTIASGVSGPGRIRYGGLRDFLIGVRFVDGTGQILHGGGKVVKNAAGFDYPKLLCGSKGSLGIIGECTFKVFPKPTETRTLLLTFKSLDDALESLHRINLSNWDADALEMDPVNKQIHLRIGGNPDALDARLPKIREVLVAGGGNVQLLPNADNIWRGLNEYAWLPRHSTLFKIPITPLKIPKLEKELSEITPHRRYSMAGNLALVAIPRKNSTPDEIKTPAPLTFGISATMDALKVPDNPLQLFTNLRLDAEPILGPYHRNPSPPLSNLKPIHERLKMVFDPQGKFPQLRN
jgi:glycolate oxidase FAD binding subunit